MAVTNEQLVNMFTKCQDMIAGRAYDRINTLGARFDVDDLMQEIWMRLQASADVCTAKTENDLKWWVLVIARNLCEDMITNERSTLSRSTLREEVAIGIATDQSRDGFQPASKTVDPAMAVQVKEECAAMLSVLDSCSKLYADAVRMRYLQSMEYSEIAVAMNTSVETVRSLVSRGVAQARAKIMPVAV